MPYGVQYGISSIEDDFDGRVITAEYLKYYVVCVNVPKSGTELENLTARQKWNKLFGMHITALNKRKPVILCGNMMNVPNEDSGKYFDFPLKNKIDSSFKLLFR